MKKEIANAFVTFGKVRKRFDKSKRKAEKVEAYWASEAEAPLGAQYKCQIALLLACAEGDVARQQFCERVVEKQKETPSSAPRRHAGTGDGDDPYDVDTYSRWLTGHQPPSPWNADLNACIDLVLLTSDDVLKGKLKLNASLRDLLHDYHGTAREALSDAISLLKSASDAKDWRRLPAQIHGVMPTGPRRGLASENAEKQYERVREALREKQSVQVSGPRYSGKNVLLRRLITDHLETGFQIATGSLLAICALSLHEISASEAISNIASFYRAALRVQPTGESISDLLSEIGHFSKQFPALFVISGVDAIDSDEIVRALNQDQLGEMISRILSGHAETRLLVSASSGKRAHLRRPVNVGKDGRILAFDDLIDLTEATIASANYEHHAVRECADALCTPARGCVREDIVARVGHLWVADRDLRRRPVTSEDTRELAEFVSEFLLTPAERLCLGLVAMSHDGLKPSTVSAIVEALRSELDPAFASLDAVAVLDRLPTEVVRKPGDGETGPECYQIERALRDPLLIHWQARSPGVFRKACWGMARAAATEARRLRLRSGLEVSAGRDVQVLLFLLACIDPASPVDEPTRVPAEHLVLPPIWEKDARMPPPSDILKFAFATLFERDLARSAEQGSRTFDARLRLAAAFPFFDNRRPWLTYAATEGKPFDFAPSAEKSPWLRLDLGGRLRLLAFTMAAATRLGSRQVMSTCARQAKLITERDGKLLPLTDQQFEVLSRIRRYELDFGILLARNPDAELSASFPSHSAEPGLAAVERRIVDLIAAIPDSQSQAGKRELRLLSARHAEVLHLRGKHVEALKKFRLAARLEAGGTADAGTMAGTLSGRSRRMYTRLLIELTRGRLFDVAGSEIVKFEDGFSLPIFDRITASPILLREANRTVEESLRSLSEGTTNDWIGAKIDQARLAAVQLRYREAFDLLDAARSIVSASGPSRDVLLEYLSVRARILTDAATFAMGVGAKSPHMPGPNDGTLKELASYLHLNLETSTLETWQRANIISEQLASLALEALGILESLVVLPETGVTRYAIFAAYLEVWIAVVRSRERVASDDPQKIGAAISAQLVDAARKFEAVLGTMTRSGYLLPYREAQLLIDAFSGVGIPVKVPPDFPAVFRS